EAEAAGRALASGWAGAGRPAPWKAPAIDALVALRRSDRTHFLKMIADLRPILAMLTSGALGELLSPSGESFAEQYSILDVINRRAVLSMGLDSLSDGRVGAALGSLLLSDLAALAGSINNFEAVHGAVNIFIDEASEIVNDPFIQLLNKGRGAGLRVFAATQTVADFVARIGDPYKAGQMIANLNNTISLRCIDKRTQEYVTSRLPPTEVRSVGRAQGVGVVAGESAQQTGTLSERLEAKAAPLLAPELLGMLPDLEFVGVLAGNAVVKGRLPLLAGGGGP
ncbi:MAG: TraM recognition domain-containing protein, partial [Duodenibacillus sp.]|nr:TraM recognition domain-containing protein [Duodenibacillus sp.]